MASSGKKKTTMAKLTRESKLRERRLDKQAKKDARKRGLVPAPDGHGDTLGPAGDQSANESASLDAGQPALEPVTQAHADA
jgi:hypothetical protein